MQIALPNDPAARDVAVAWLERSRIPHHRLEQAVQIPDLSDAARFFVYLANALRREL